MILKIYWFSTNKITPSVDKALNESYLNNESRVLDIMFIQEILDGHPD